MSWKKKLLLIAGIGLLAILCLAGVVLFKIHQSTPSVETVRREFLVRYPNSTIRNVELIFEQDGGVVYLVTARDGDSTEVRKYDFALKRSNGSWAWCDDQTDNPCGPIAK